MSLFSSSNIRTSIAFSESFFNTSVLCTGIENTLSRRAVCSALTFLEMTQNCLPISQKQRSSILRLATKVGRLPNVSELPQISVEVKAHDPLSSTRKNIVGARLTSINGQLVFGVTLTGSYFWSGVNQKCLSLSIANCQCDGYGVCLVSWEAVAQQVLNNPSEVVIKPL